MATTEERPLAERPARFEDLGLSSTVLDAVASMGYDAPTPVQEQAIPAVLAGRDVLAAAQTGTGKTAAFLLPTMNRLPRVPQTSARGKAAAQGPLMLVVTPTRELAQQIEEVCGAIAAHTGHTSVTVVGGVGYNPQKAALKRGCDILIATPGRLLDLIDQEACSLSQVSVLVLDEADRMLDMGFAPDVRKIVGHVPVDRQTLLFSATLDQKAVGSITDLVHDPVRIEIAPVTRPTETVAQYVLPVSLDAKNGLLADVLKHQGARRVIVFCRTKRRADTCCKRLSRAGFTCQAIHGNRTQAQRERSLAAFRAGECDVLVATDVLSRGIDISDVSYVVNFDVPSDPVDYIHRIGRTGRAGELGWSLTFVTPDDVDEFYDIEALMGKTVECFDARGLDVGEGAPYLDPFRVPAAQVPGKKARKRRRANARAGAAGAKSAAKVQAARSRRADAVREQGGSAAAAGQGRAADQAAAPASARSGSGGGPQSGAGSRVAAGSQPAAGPRPAADDDFELLSEHEARAAAAQGRAAAGGSGKGSGKASGKGAGRDAGKASGKGSNQGSGKGRTAAGGAGKASGKGGSGQRKGASSGAKQRGGRADSAGSKQRGGRSGGHAHKQAGDAAARSGGKGAASGSSRESSASRGAQREAWRNYDEPDGRYGRGSVRAGAGGTKGRSSKSARRPGDGGGSRR